MILNLHKPSGITSHTVISILRNITGEKRIGHAGTLDPFASGVLVVAITRAYTKQLGEISIDTEKEYIATLELGKVSSTGDSEGEITTLHQAENLQHLDAEHIRDALHSFLGKSFQTPPQYSAVKVKGKTAYKLVRKGISVELPEREICIYDIELLEFTVSTFNFRVKCSSGTYIRALGSDIGKKLGVGAYVSKLVRTKVGDFHLEDSIALENVKEYLEKHAKTLEREVL